MTGLPTIQVLLDNGTGTYPTDISTRLEGAVSFSGFGRTDEFSGAEAAQLTFTLDNTDGAVSSGAVAIAPGTGIRVKFTSGATTVNRFTGRVSSLDLGWPGGGQQFSTVDVTAVDLLADLSRRPLRSMLEQEYLLDAPTAYYTLAEAQGSTSAGDTSGNGVPSLALSGLGAAVVFGNGTGPTDGLSAVQFAGGQKLVGTGFAASTSTHVSFGVWINAAVLPATGQVLFEASPLVSQVGVTIGGNISVTLVGASLNSVANVCDGNTHSIVITYDGSNIRIYVDGALDNIAAAGGSAVLDAKRALGGAIGSGAGFVGTVSHFAMWDATTLSAPQAASISSVGHGATETTAARFTRIASYAGATVATPVNSGQLMSMQDTSGQSVADALQDVAAAESGVAFADGSGVLQLQGHGYRAQKLTATLALPAEEPSEDTSIVFDTSQIINSVSVTRTGGAQQTYTDPSASASTGPGMFPQSLDMAVADDTSALSRAQWLVNKYKTPTPRIASLTVTPSASITTPASILSLNIGDRVSLVLPSQNWAGAGDYVIEGWDESVDDTWSITYNVLPWSLFQSAIYDDPGTLYNTSGVYA